MLRTTFGAVRFSPIYASAPVGFKDQAEFLNAAALFETKLSPEKVAAKLRTIEKKLKKSPPHKFGPRTIDLDILFFGKEIRLEDELTIPHLALHERAFVILPLIDLDLGDFVHPGFDTKLKTYLPKIKKQVCKRTKLKEL